MICSHVIELKILSAKCQLFCSGFNVLMFFFTLFFSGSESYPWDHLSRPEATSSQQQPPVRPTPGYAWTPARATSTDECITWPGQPPTPIESTTTAHVSQPSALRGRTNCKYNVMYIITWSISSKIPSNLYYKSHTQSPNINVSCLVLQLSLINPLKPGVKLRMKM